MVTRNYSNFELEVAGMMQKFNPFAGEDRAFSWWWFGLKVGIVTALIIWWWLENRNKKSLETISKTSLAEGKSIPLPDEELQVEPKQESSKPEAIQPDNLRKIEGIGPKIQTTLQAAGVETFAQLAASKPENLKQILVDAGIRLGDPTTWPEQAALAAAENWDELEEFQGTLKGGRR
jgi:predicted flap endonuclease-1-like 5' DNA nuclease